ncbi:zinc metalloproteinase nas-13 [Biomphalaria pfeifferi]|uniref:Zinc metalloproteinase nas-13 n=1 Tax=Biomphalaria pfeifferi TaxID=112525 RepID=A0AAD8AX93_BIOPF|nr:zinc metalloproteinase nas-13 [Biomphalaria pfeifferi]
MPRPMRQHPVPTARVRGQRLHMLVSGSPVQLCAKTGTVQTTPKPATRATSPAPTCSDTRCQSWAKAGYCNRI